MGCNYKGITFCFFYRKRFVWGKKRGGNYKRLTDFFKAGCVRFFLRKKRCDYNVNTKINFIEKSKYYLKHVWDVQKSNNNVFTHGVYCIYFVITFCFFIPLNGLANPLIELKTPIVQGSFVYGRSQPDVDVYYGDTKLVKTPDNQFVFALPQDTEDTLILKAVQHGKTHILSSPIGKRTWKEEVVNGLPPQKVLPNLKDQQRIASENKLLRAGRSETFYEKMPMCFVRPISKKARISSEFGARRILNGVKTAGHSGTDYAMPTGTPLFAPADGVVKVVHPDMFYSGKTVLIDHGYGIFSSYSHMSDILVHQGEHVVQGQQIGEVGTTGRSTGPHLHFTMTWFGVRVDPEFVLTYYSCDK